MNNGPKSNDVTVGKCSPKAENLRNQQSRKLEELTQMRKAIQGNTQQRQYGD